MDLEKYKQLKDILARALALPEEERDSFLEQTCFRDQELLTEARELLSFDITRANDLALPDYLPNETYVGKTIANYRIVEIIGAPLSITEHFTQHFYVLLAKCRRDEFDGPASRPALHRQNRVAAGAIAYRSEGCADHRGLSNIGQASYNQRADKKE